MDEKEIHTPVEGATQKLYLASASQEIHDIVLHRTTLPRSSASRLVSLLSLHAESTSRNRWLGRALAADKNQATLLAAVLESALGNLFCH